MITSVLQHNGLHVIAFPGLVICALQDEGPVREAVETIDSFDWIIFFDRASAEYYLDFLEHTRKEVHFPEHIRIMVIGQGAAEVFRTSGQPVQIMPREHTARELVNSMGHIEDSRILLVKQKHTLHDFSGLLARQGAHIDQITGYALKVAVKKGLVEKLRRNNGPDAVVLVNATAVRSYARALKRLPLNLQHKLSKLVFFVAGPATAQAAYNHHFTPTLIADDSPESLVRLVVNSLLPHSTFLKS
ncbi:uroporphyrinogen-III synthase [bacterium]|nr:uroporphyrinogen-III synthase [bacterium]